MRFLECYFEGAKAGKIHARCSLPKHRADGLGTSLPGRLERRHAALLDVTHSRWFQAAKAPGTTHHMERLLFPPASYSRINDSASHPSPRRRIKLSDPSQPSVDKQNSQARPCAAPARPLRYGKQPLAHGICRSKIQRCSIKLGFYSSCCSWVQVWWCCTSVSANTTPRTPLAMSNIACGRCEVGAEVYDGVCRARDYVWVLTEVRLGTWGGCAGEGWVETSLEERARYARTWPAIQSGSEGKYGRGHAGWFLLFSTGRTDNPE